MNNSNHSPQVPGGEKKGGHNIENFMIWTNAPDQENRYCSILMKGDEKCRILYKNHFYTVPTSDLEPVACMAARSLLNLTPTELPDPGSGDIPVADSGAGVPPVKKEPLTPDDLKDLFFYEEKPRLFVEGGTRDLPDPVSSCGPDSSLDGKETRVNLKNTILDSDTSKNEPTIVGDILESI